MLKIGFILEPRREHFSISNCKHVGMTQKYRWKSVEYSFIFHANLLQLLFRSIYSGVQIGISNLILKQTVSSLRITSFLDFAHRPEFLIFMKHSVSDTGSVSVLR
jgi:hypothetical protein